MALLRLEEPAWHPFSFHDLPSQLADATTTSMSTGPEKEFRFRFSLRGLLIALVVLGAGFGILGRLFRQNPQIFSVVVAILSTIVPYICAVGTIFWISARRRNSGLFLWGLLLIAIPFVGLGVVALSQRYVGTSPSNLGVLSTKQLIDDRLPKQLDAPWVWRELEQRLKSGTLSQEEAEAAVGKLIAHMKSTKPQGWDQPLSWQRDFLIIIDRAGLLSDAVKFDLSDAFYGPTAVLQPLPRLREGNTGFDVGLEYGSTWSDHSAVVLALLCHVDQVLLDGTPIKVEQERKHSGSWSGYYDGAVSPGEHELTVELTCAYVDKEKLIGLETGSLPPNRWPNAAKKWKHNVSAPLKVFTVDEPLVKLITDADLDPRGAIEVKRCVIQSYKEEQKKVIVQLEFTPALSVPLSCDVSITLAGETIPLGSKWVVRRDNGQSGGGTGLTGVIESLAPEIEYADITLTPTPRHIEHRSEVTEIWGKPITLHSVPVERLDLEVQPTN